MSVLLLLSHVLQDNGPSYIGVQLPLLLPYICRVYEVRMVQFTRNEAGDGKTCLDAAFGVMSDKLRGSVTWHNNRLFV